MVNELQRGKLLKRAGLVILLGACAMLMSATQASAVLIDHWSDAFDCTSGTLTVNSANPTQTDTQSGLAVRGGTRVTTLTFQGDLGTGLTGTSTSRTTLVTFVNTVLTYNNDTGVTSKLDSFYNGGGAGLGDLTGGGIDSFMSLRLLQTDQGAEASITVKDTHGNSATLMDSTVGGLLFPGTTFFYPFASFTGVDFTSVLSVNLELTQVSPQNSVDFAVDVLETGNPVPEPLTMLGVFLGVGGVGAYIRKRRMA